MLEFVPCYAPIPILVEKMEKTDLQRPLLTFIVGMQLTGDVPVTRWDVGFFIQLRSQDLTRLDLTKTLCKVFLSLERVKRKVCYMKHKIIGHANKLLCRFCFKVTEGGHHVNLVPGGQVT